MNLPIQNPSLSGKKQQICIGTHGPFGLSNVHIPVEALDTHLYIVGMTGKGKSSYMLSLAHQLINLGQGVGVIDPHGDLVTDLLDILATHPRKQPWLSQLENRRRVIYIDPRAEYVVPFNPLAARETEPYVTAQGIIETFKRAWPTELAAAPRFANIALFSLLVLIENRLSLLELPQLLTDKAYREQLLAQVTNPEVIHFFHDRFDRWGKETPLMIESLLNKSTALTLNPYLSPMLGAAGCLSLRQVMDQGRVLLVNLRTPDEETRNLLGSLIMTMFEQAALSRESLPKARRRKFFLLIDEFQKFTANEGSVATLAEILSECRKYGLHLVFAHQSWGQLSSYQRLSGALEQAQVKAIFGTGRQTAQAIAGSLYLPDPALVKHQVDDTEQQARSHPLFESVQNQLEVAVQQIMRLRKRQIVVKLPESDRLFNLKTPTVPAGRLRRAQITQIKTALARQAGRPRHELARASIRRVQTLVVPSPSVRQPAADFWDDVGTKRTVGLPAGV